MKKSPLLNCAEVSIASISKKTSERSSFLILRDAIKVKEQ